MKRSLYPLFMVAALLTAACTDDHVDEVIDNSVPTEQKEAISFTVSDLNRMDAGSAKTRAGFSAATRIVARFESKHLTESKERYTRTVLVAQPQDEGKDYSLVDYYKPSSSDVSDASYKRFWDDAFGRNASISVYAVAIPGKNSETVLPENKLYCSEGYKVSNSNVDWRQGDPDNNNNISWSVTTTAQTAVLIAEQDLCYSNNIQQDGDLGKYGRYVWNFNTTPEGYPAYSGVASNHKDGPLSLALKNANDKTKDGHFDKGHLIFRHALTRLTVNIKKGSGFTNDSPFAFSEGSNVKILNVPVSGTLNIKSGNWAENPTKDNIAKMSTTSKDGFNHSLIAQFVPGYVFASDDNTKTLEFTIDDNTYYITAGMIYKALTYGGKDASNNDIVINQGEIETIGGKNAIQMKQGKNYVLDITLNKTGVNVITASLVEWVDVQSANIDATNSYLTIELMDQKDTKCENFDLYRLDANYTDIYVPGSTLPNLINWGGNYTDKASLTPVKNAENKITGWKTAWSWASNKSFYHLRSIDSGMKIEASDSDTDDYIKVFAGPVQDNFKNGDANRGISAAVNSLLYNDYHWGAPMKQSADLKYSLTEGYTSSLYPAIGSSESQINIIEQHMMSDVQFVIHTGTRADGTPVAESAKVTLLDAEGVAARLTLTNFYGAGQVKVGNGLVTPTGSLISSDIPAPGATPAYGAGNVLTNEAMKSASGQFFKTSNTVTKEYCYRVVPQELKQSKAGSEDTFIGLTITTPDGNQYYVRSLYNVTASSVSGSNTNQKTQQPITYWYPGHRYTYHIYINKTGIEAITCSVVDWVIVEGTVGDISLES